MDCYVDVRIVKDPEFGSNQILSVVFSKLHIALVKIKSTGIGVSFPNESSKGLGDHLRLHGSRDSLAQLLNTAWLAGLKDHVKVTEISERPQGCKFRAVRRAQAKSSPERLRRRAMRRHGLDEKAVAERIPDAVAESLDLPYIRMASSSTQQPFRLFVRHGPVVDSEVGGQFSTYGLSYLATIPWF
jgi:CRISPR-associated endonuclease Csy4